MNELDEILQCICRLTLPPWNHCVPSDLTTKKITGGLTNELYSVSYCDGQDTSHILVRIFGKSDGLLNREVENEIFISLSNKNISPRLMGVYPWGRIEEFLFDRKPLSSGTDMVRMDRELDCVELIAKALQSLHSTSLDLDPSRASANIFKVLEKWLCLASKYGSCIRVSPRCPEFETPSIESLSREVEYVTRKVREKLFSHKSVVSNKLCQRLLARVLCHNDMLSGNIMLNEVDKSVRLIDFEYAGMNHAAADIANVFTAVCESIMLSGQAQDVKLNFPSEAIQKHFLECYLGESITDRDLRVILTVISGFAMADELRWTIWGIIQASQSEVDFDYVFYYHSRFNAYREYVNIFTSRYSLL